MKKIQLQCLFYQLIPFKWSDNAQKGLVSLD